MTLDREIVEFVKAFARANSARDIKRACNVADQSFKTGPNSASNPATTVRPSSVAV